MRFCLNSNQSSEYLDKADEIKLPYKDIDYILELVSRYPTEKTFVIDCFKIQEIDWKMVRRYDTIAQHRLILCLGDIDLLRSANAIGIRSYFGYPISSFFELNSILMFNPEYVLLDTGLFFSMEAIKRFNIKVRAVPNLAYNDNLPHENGVPGTWVRPEDLTTIYKDYIDTVEFADCDTVQKEQALYRVYAIDKEWRTELNLLITNLDYEAVNRMIPSSISEKRLNCGQVCQQKGACRTCYRAMDLANPILIADYRKEIKE